MSKSTESIFDGKDVLIPLAEVSYILKFPSCIEVHFKGSAESVTLVQPDQNALISAWCRYRSEVEADTLMDLGHAHPTPSIPEAVMEVIAGLVREVERNTCTHEETHRGGFIWEICDMCGAKWADDSGGKPEFKWPEVVEKARSMLEVAPGAQPAPSILEGWVNELLTIEHAMAMNNWNWNSDASDDLKLEAYTAVTRLLAAAPEAKP